MDRWDRTGCPAPPLFFPLLTGRGGTGEQDKKKPSAVSTHCEGKAQSPWIPPYEGAMRHKGQENKQITEQGMKMKYVQYNTLRLELRSTGESVEQP